jgi:predicted nucleic acid-binding protein
VTLVVSDNSPLNILVRVDCVEVLAKLFSEVVIPTEVVYEMGHQSAPEVIQEFVNKPPSWLVVKDPSALLLLPNLDLGELAAISLAKELAVPLLIDERLGRRVAKEQGLEVIGAVGVLERAADLGVITDLASVHERIRGLDFHISESVLAASLARHQQNIGKLPSANES